MAGSRAGVVKPLTGEDLQHHQALRPQTRSAPPASDPLLPLHQQQHLRHASAGTQGRAWVTGMQAGSEGSSCSMGNMRCQRFLKGMAPVLRTHPGIWITALLVTLALAAVSVIAVAFAAQAEKQNRLLAAQGASADARSASAVVCVCLSWLCGFVLDDLLNDNSAVAAAAAAAVAVAAAAHTPQTASLTTATSPAIPKGFAENAAVGFEAQLQQLMAPLLALSVFVREKPSVPYIVSRFDAVATELLSELPVSDARLVNLQLAPQGVVRLMHPLKGNEVAIGIDQLRGAGCWGWGAPGKGGGGAPGV